MGRAGATLVTAVAAAGLALPAVAGAALPKQGRFVKRDQVKGLYMETTRHSVRTLWLFCRRPDYDHDGAHYEFRAARFEVPHPLHVRSNGTFSFRGYGRR